MNDYCRLAASVKYTRKKRRMILEGKDASLSLVGMGRSAFVFKIPSDNKAVKVFFPEFKTIAREEAEIYRLLKGIPQFPVLHESGDNYLVMDYIEGMTLFDCLTQGIPIDLKKIEEVDRVLMLAKERGLNPSDIHLRNILITSEGEIKMIDVARFRQTKDCLQWRDLKRAFHWFYFKPFFPKKIPAHVLNMIAAVYKKRLIPSLH